MRAASRKPVAARSLALANSVARFPARCRDRRRQVFACRARAL